MKRLFAIFLAISLALSLVLFTSAEKTHNELPEPKISSGAALVMDKETGTILYQKNINEKLSPADTVQILTILLGIESGDINRTVTVTKEIIDSVDREGSHISLSPEENVVFKDLLYATMLTSAADAAKTIAHTVSGSPKDFADGMNRRAKELGAENSLFTNPDGTYDENQYTTAKDLAVLTGKALENKTFQSIFAQSSYTMGETNKNTTGRSFTTLCLLMKNSDMNVKYESAIGGKTGWNEKSGYNLVSAATKDGRTLICVILNAETSKKRYEETIALFDYAFSAYRNVAVPTSLLTPTEIPVMRDGVIVRKITVSIPEETYFSTNVEFQEGTMTVSSLPKHLNEGDTNLQLTVSAKDMKNNTVVLGTVSLDVETRDVSLEEAPGGEKVVTPSVASKVWKVIGTILLIIVCVIGGICLLIALLILVSYLQRRKRKALRRRRLEEERNEAEAEANQNRPVGRRHKKDN